MRAILNSCFGSLHSWMSRFRYSQRLWMAFSRRVLNLAILILNWPTKTNWAQRTRYVLTENRKMMRTNESNVWCDLASQWIASNGIEDLDPLQRMRFKKHASRCPECAGFRLQVSDEKFADLDISIEWPHVADETLRLMVTDNLSPEERKVIETLVEPHLQVCDYCADRLAASEEWPEPSDPSEAVVGRAVTSSIRWMNNRAELGWVMDQAATGLSI